ncbi:Major facilitator superfamily [Trypanosoma melophagium]|uniref:Major facilitator superfamily n=1 Tax=Trypanosoma melophagium TaxID=715481 RepID=UPI00351A51C9|nr:Major facilitator superfamily [Trypanosoma melophagium]
MVFCYFLLPYGAIYDYFGPLPVYVLACLFFFIGALLMALSFDDRIQGTTVRFCVYNAFLSLGSQLFDLATVVTLLSIFPSNRGAVVAILKTLFGLGSAIIGAFYLGFFRGNPSNFFYFLIALVFCVGFLVLAIVRLPLYHLTGYEQKHLSDEEKERRLVKRAVYLRQKAPLWRFFFGLIIIIVLIVFLPLQSLLLYFLKLGRPYYIAFAISTAVITLLLPLMAIPCHFLDRRYGDDETEQQEEQHNGDKNKVEEEIDQDKYTEVEANRLECGLTTEMENDSSNQLSKTVTVVETDVDYIAPQYQTTFMQSVCTLKLWAIFWTFFCGVGSEFVIIFNARFILAALSGEFVEDSMGTLLTVINGVGSAVGRLLMSYFEIWTQKRKAEDRIPITISLFIPTVMVIVAMVLFLVLPSKVALLPFAIAAVGNGFCAAVSILVVRTIYAKDPAKHYNFAFNALWTSAVLLNRLLYGEWFAHEAEKQGSQLCYGRRCVLMPLLVMIALNVTGLGTAAYVHICYYRFSRKVLAERLHLKEAAAAEAASSREPVDDRLSEM